MITTLSLATTCLCLLPVHVGVKRAVYECECTLKALKLLLSGRLDRGVVTGIGFSKKISGFQVDTVVAQLNQTKPKGVNKKVTKSEVTMFMSQYGKVSAVYKKGIVRDMEEGKPALCGTGSGRFTSELRRVWYYRLSY